MTKKDRQNKAREEVNKRKTPEVMKGITAKLVEREEAKRRKLADLGIDYDFPGYAAGAKAVEDKKEKDEQRSTKKRRKVSMDDKENSADDEVDNLPKTPKSSRKKATKANTEVKKDKKKKDKKRKSLA